MVVPAPGAEAPGAGAARVPPALRPGDRVALFSPSSHAGRQPPANLDEARAVLEGWGLQPEPLPADPPRHLYLAGPDEERAGAFQRLYCDPEIKALFATRGGYGAARLLPLLDAGRIAAAPPKAVVGMSDVVALLGYLYRVAGVASYHGPCLAAPRHVDSPHRSENEESLRRYLFDPGHAPALPCGILHAPAGGPERVTGRLAGGCLAVLAASVGTPWAPDTDGALLFVEDVDEAPYRIDRYLTQLRQGGHFEGLRGIAFGHLRDCDGHPPGLLAQVLRDLFRDAPFPVATGVQAGHGALNLTLPLGRPAALTLDDGLVGGAGTLQVL